MNLTRSGTADAPITFDAVPEAGAFSVSGFTVSGASHIVIRRMSADIADGPQLTISGATDVTIDRAMFGGPYVGHPAVHVTAGSQGVRVIRSKFGGSGGTGTRQQIVVDGGSSDTVISNNLLGNGGYPQTIPQVSVDGASGTAITNNTFGYGCTGPRIAVTGASTDTAMENNIIPIWTPPVPGGNPGTACSSSKQFGISVASDSLARTVTGYNVFITDASARPYEWAGVPYSSVAAFQTATKQGAHDLTEDRPNTVTSACTGNQVSGLGSPVIDSADASARGVLPIDFRGNQPADDLDVLNTGTGSGFLDRGAEELTNCVEFRQSASEPAGRRGWHVSLSVSQTWHATRSVEIAWGDGTSSAFSAAQLNQRVEAEHVYGSFGTFQVTETLDPGVGARTLTTIASPTGSGYIPVSPVRVLDTRDGTGTGGLKRAVPPRGTVQLSTEGIIPSEVDVSAVVLNVTAVNPAADGHVTAYGHGGPVPNASMLNFVRGGITANLITVESGQVDLLNGSTGATNLVVDVEGYYLWSGGKQYHPMSPTRILDSRTAPAGGVATMVPAGSEVSVKVAGVSGLPAHGVAAVALNVTEADAIAGGFITVRPGGTDLTNASNLNFTPGQIVANMSVTGVGTDGTVTLFNSSSKPVNLIVDMEGYYADGGLSFTPVAPQRRIDTRSQCCTLAPHQARSIVLDDLGENYPGHVSSQYPGYAAVLNFTVTNPTGIGHLDVYPSGTTRPTASNLNFTSGQTVANMSMATLGADRKVAFYNGSGGNVDVIADLEGYFS
ncbi:hypothetical protein QMK19_32390 [Streptomyces sp. H10-C2]|uniref:hypothetical protein n=1 Tax=Streptomyces sp. H10-C2 TaxID=3046210 RepID=UPI0024B9A22A|nr:hypothetical protein [Streptomyces sp. H10-C2]MDJ0374204.1 hypothetical protein [Streptomyces sp. H10-C2]